MTPTLPGRELSEQELQKFAGPGVLAEVARLAQLRRVTSEEGAALVGRNGGGQYGGTIIPYVLPGETFPREYRLRRDAPEMEPLPGGGFRERNKYLSPPGRGNMIYFVPGTDPVWLADTGLPLVITEGEKKSLALLGVAWHMAGDAAERPAFLPLALPGVWNWRGTIGKTTGPDGDRRDVKGPIPDLDRLDWHGRKVTIIFDVNVASNDSVRAARYELSRELERRGARVHWFTWPADTPSGVNGVDDLTGLWGAARVAELIAAAKPWRHKEETDRRTMTVADVPSVRSFSDVDRKWVIEGLIAEATVNMLAGESGDGKSFFALALAGYVANGNPFLGRHTPRRPVLYLDRENPLSVVVERFSLLGLRDSETFKVWGGWCPEEAPDTGSATVLSWVAACEPRPLIVVDSLIAFHPGDENSAAETREYLHHYRRLADAGATILILHHSGKAESARQYRGSSDIKASLDAGYHLAKIGKAGPLEHLTLKPFKSRFGPAVELRIKFTSDGQFSRFEEDALGARSNTEMLTELLRANPGIQVADFEKLAKEQGLGRNRARTFVKDGQAAGRIRLNRHPVTQARSLFWTADGEDDEDDDDLGF